MTAAIEPGFMVLQGNRLEDLRQIALDWMTRNPLPPLENDVLLVQSNGIAQWLRMSMAAEPDAGGWGIAFGVDVMLPARFQWLAYRRVIEAVEGEGTVPPTSPYDKTRLRWRLMDLIPARSDEPVFQPLKHFLGDDPDQRKRYQLAERLADLYDQYQVYRADWLQAWGAGADVIIDPRGEQRPLADDQRWQAQLWRDIEASLPPEQHPTHRAAVHARFLDAARALTPDNLPPGLPRRIIVFGISALPRQTLEALAALSGAVQIMLCTVNPCRYYWGDIVEHRELLRAEYRRQTRKQSMPAALSETELHLHAHPLLAAWGKQGRDYLHLLDEHDDTDRYAPLFQAARLRIDLFETPATDSLLGQLQDDILELRPLNESRDLWPEVDPERDRSLVFHIAHGPQRELEVLHDQLLDAFARDATLQPRDVIVMVPDVDTFAPYVHAVFGQYAADDPRCVPYQVADQQIRHRVPVLAALEQLLSLPRLRFRASEVVDLLEVPAVRARFGLAEADLPILQRWIHDANIRWGLHAEQRTALDLPEHDDLHTWRFGLERMLLGYAVGAVEPGAATWQDVVPYDETAGLDAALVGPLYRFIETLDRFREALERPRTPTNWVELLHELLAAFYAPEDTADQRLLGQLQDGLDAWLEECADADFTDEIPLSIVRESWLARLDQPRLTQRFLGGKVTFATLMPMRAIPFRHVCLLGMNDNDYPRRALRSDFDLMAMPGQYRPGDRSRREDDRYLLLEALLSARDTLYISWAGRSLQDNSERPPSVLISQLRDHLAAGWRLQGGDERGGAALLAALTTEHPLQPFGEPYFFETETGDDAIATAARERLFTYAHEWTALHAAPTVASDDAVPLPLWVPEGELRLRHLEDFLRDPLEQFYRQRLQVYLDDELETLDDDEPFQFDGLATWSHSNALLQPLGRRLAADPALDIEAELARLREYWQRAGAFPPTPFGPLRSEPLVAEVAEIAQRYREQIEMYPTALDTAPAIELRAEAHIIDLDAKIDRHVPLSLHDSVDQVRESATGAARVVLLASKLHRGRSLRWRHIVRYWPAHLALQITHPHTPTHLVGGTDTVTLPGLDAATAQQRLQQLLQAWLEAMQTPWPLDAELGCAAWRCWSKLDADARETGWQAALAADSAVTDAFQNAQEQRRVWARTFDTLDEVLSHPDFLDAAQRLYAPLMAALDLVEETA